MTTGKCLPLNPGSRTGRCVAPLKVPLLNKVLKTPFLLCKFLSSYIFFGGIAQQKPALEAFFVLLKRERKKLLADKIHLQLKYTIPL